MLFNDVDLDAAAGKKVVRNASGFKTIYKPKVGGLRFADLLKVSLNYLSELY